MFIPFQLQITVQKLQLSRFIRKAEIRKIPNDMLENAVDNLSISVANVTRQPGDFAENVISC